jgi:hypothetical protein
MPQEIAEYLSGNPKVIEGYVLVREVKVLLSVENEHGYVPTFKIKVYYGPPTGRPYTYDLSHYVKTPSQIGPYISSHNAFISEIEAIESAINANLSFLKLAIGQGLTPDDSWLQENKHY